MRKIPPELVEAFARGDGTVFVGAGLSIGVGYPSWAELVRPLAAEIDDCPPWAAATQIAQLYEAAYHRNRLMQVLRAKLERPMAGATPVHDAIFQLPIRRVFTTNFDRVIEDALGRAKQPYDCVIRDSDVGLTTAAHMQVIKIHGDIKDVESIVVTQHDYNDFREKRPAIADLLKVELQSRTVLFMGYSHSDEDLQKILSRVSHESRQLRRNLFSVQFAPSRTAQLALEHEGITVIALEASADDAARTATLRDWLCDFARQIKEYRGRGLPAHVNHNLPPRLSELVGRQEASQRVMTALGAQARFPVVTVEGFAGVGKTSLAVEVGYLCATESPEAVASQSTFDFVVWASAKDKPDQKRWLNDVLNAVATTTHFPVITQAEDIERKKTQVEPLLKTYRVLIIIDNFETIDDPELLAWIEAIPRPSKVLLTTRNRQLHQKAWAVELRGLTVEEGMKLLRQHGAYLRLAFIQDAAEDTLLPLFEVTGGNPQAMKLALGLLAGRGSEALAHVVNQLHGANVNESMDIVFQTLFAQSWAVLNQSAREILLVTPMFVGVSSIRRDALEAVAGLDDKSFEFHNGLAQCEQLGLLEPEGGAANSAQPRYATHSMTRAFAQLKLRERPGFEAAARRRSTDYFLALVGRAVTRAEPGRRYWNALVSDSMKELDPEWPSIEEVIARADANSQFEVVIQFVMLLVHYMDSRFLNRERLIYVEKAITALAQSGRHEDESLLRIDALGWTYVEENRLSDAYDEIEAGFRLAEKFAGDEREDLRALGYAWRARVRIEQGRVGEAQDLIAEALAIESSPWIKCRVFMAAGDIALKERKGEQALQMYEYQANEARKYGDEGRGYQWRPRIGMAHLELGQLDEARQAFKELQEASREIAIGGLYAEYGLAMVAYGRGDVSNARAMIDRIRAKLQRRTNSNLLLKMIDRFYSDLKKADSLRS